MPIYEVTHSHPLDDAQKEALAKKITYLHSRAFTTPSLFVNVAFSAVDATVKHYYVAGKAQTTCVNRIKAYVRTSESRSKQHFDTLAEQIEDAWTEVVAGQQGKQANDNTAVPEMTANKLLNIAFVPIITARELGTAIPSAGSEGAWVKEYRKDFEKRAELGEEEFSDMLQEIDQREDLAGWRS